MFNLSAAKYLPKKVTCPSSYTWSSQGCYAMVTYSTKSALRLVVGVQFLWQNGSYIGNILGGTPNENVSTNNTSFGASSPNNTASPQLVYGQFFFQFYYDDSMTDKTAGNYPLSVLFATRVTAINSPGATGETHLDDSKLWRVTAKVTIQSRTCDISLSQSSLILLEDTLTWNDLQNSYNSGDNFGSATTDATLTCDSGLLPQIYFVDNNSTSNASNIVTLTNQGNSGVAKGVGVQIFMNSITADSSLTAATVTSGALTLNTKYDLLTSNTLSNGDTISTNLGFKYIKTSSTVDAGKADAIININVSYK